ncbi:MAG: ABATE domain-containing protein [Candidatus Dormibacteraeota bacterium]|nr:ABATE domain-containing protein [Candidatus Dormibacteraeota bacterium]
MDSAIESFPDLIGGSLSLNFVNTVDDRLDARPVEHLSSYAALVAWCRYAGAVDEAEAGRLAKLAGKGGDAALARSTQVREALYSVLAAVIERRPAAQAELKVVNRALADLLGPPLVSADGPDLRLAAVGEAGLDLNTPLRRVLRSAVDLASRADIRLVRQCAAPDCSFLFLDTTKSHNRRWCRSGGCGTRNRFRRYYARHRNPG